MEIREAKSEPRGLKLANEVYDREALELRAWELIRNRERIEHDTWGQEPEINARTAIFEELTAKGHLSLVEFDERPDEINARTIRRLLNGWSDDLPKWEQRRRYYEIVEELTIQAVWQDVQAGRLPKDALVITISNYPELVPEHEAAQIGYGVLNRKGMVRSTDFESGYRRVEQVSRSYSNDHSSRHFFAENGLRLRGAESLTFLSNQIIATKEDFPDGVVDVQRALDRLAGPTIIYGEDRNQTDLYVPQYENLRAVSSAREEQAEHFINQLAALERELNTRYKAGLISYEQKLREINRQRKMIVNQICLLEPIYAKDARGEASAQYFEQAALAMAAGDDAGGIAHLENALAAADPLAGAVCGGNGLIVSKETSADATAEIFLGTKEARRFWKWKKGLCIVKECPTRPEKTEVGPCSVCRNCQKIFDNGSNPKTVYGALGFLDLIIQAFRQPSQEETREKLR